MPEPRVEFIRCAAVALYCRLLSPIESYLVVVEAVSKKLWKSQNPKQSQMLGHWSAVDNSPSIPLLHTASKLGTLIPTHVMTVNASIHRQFTRCELGCVN